MPRLHSVVTVTIDPVATVEALEDEEATDVAKQLKPATYIAFVHKVRRKSESMTN